MAFDFGLWSDGALPLLFVCEEAHRYAPADRNAGFAPTRRALMRIAKEGRKYGVYLGLVTQRPAELDPTIISQCNTLFAMRHRQRARSGAAALGGDGRGRQPAGLRAFARHARSGGVRRRPAAADAAAFHGTAAGPPAAQRNVPSVEDCDEAADGGARLRALRWSSAGAARPAARGRCEDGAAAARREPPRQSAKPAPAMPDGRISAAVAARTVARRRFSSGAAGADVSVRDDGAEGGRLRRGRRGLGSAPNPRRRAGARQRRERAPGSARWRDAPDRVEAPRAKAARA